MLTSWVRQLLGNKGTYSLLVQNEIEVDSYPSPFGPEDDNDEFGGRQARITLERQVLRKIDLRMSMLILIYVLNYIDRNNIAAARLRGYEEDLHLEGNQFNTILACFQIGYATMQVPSNIFLNYNAKPSIYLPCCMIIWGSISVLSGTVTNFLGALVTRIVLGLSEAAFFPGALFLISKWYKRSEIGFRMSLFICGSLVSNAFGALLASAILDVMEGVRGWAAWRWLFFVEGGLTILVAIAAFVILPDFPATSKFLTPLERQLALKRMEEDARSRDDDEMNFKTIWSALFDVLQDWKVWCIVLAHITAGVSWSLSLFFPTIAATMGYGPIVTLLLCAPPWLLATGVSLAVTRHSDISGERFYHVTGPMAVGIVGFLIASFTMNTLARYFSLFLMAITVVNLASSFAWVSSTISRPPSKRAVALALVNATSQLGTVAGAYVWPKSWGPTYALSCWLCILTNVMAIGFYWLLREHLKGENIKEEKREARDGREPGFRYML